MQTNTRIHNTEQKEGNAMNINPNCGNNRKEKQMNAITKTTLIAVLGTLGLALAARTQAADAPPDKADRTATITARMNDSTTGAGMNQFEYVGKWTHQSADNVNYHEGDISFSNTAGDTMRIRFFGTRVRLYGVRAAHLGTGMVSVDDGEEREAVFRAAGNEYKVMVYESPVLPAGPHTLKLRVTNGYSVPDYVEIDTPRGEPGKIEIPGSDSELVPKAGSISVRYSSRIYNAHGYEVPGETATWRLQSPVKGVSLDAKTGVITINNTAEVGSAFTLVATAGAVQASKTVALPAPKFTHTLGTDDTSLTLCVAGNRIYITSLKNPAQGWNWCGTACEMPLPKVNNGTVPNWVYDTCIVDNTNGTTLMLKFTSSAPNLELGSIWRVRPGVGPVEHKFTVKNNTGGQISFAETDLIAAKFHFTADGSIDIFPVASGTSGTRAGEADPLMYQILDSKGEHGLYLAYDYGCGSFSTTQNGGNVDSHWYARHITETATAPGETFRCPGIFMETYKGDKDTGANNFKKWFWTYEITRSLYNTPSDPPIEICEPGGDGKDGNVQHLIDLINSSNLAGMGIGLFKTDLWYKMAGHPRSDELKAACTKNGLQLALYWNGAWSGNSYSPTEWNKSHYDYVRTDSGPFKRTSYSSFTYFNRLVDEAYNKFGVKYENCSDGGMMRTMDVMRRMTFMTHSDHSGLIPFFVNVYHWSYMMPPIQLKNDYWVCEGNAEEGKVTVAWLRGNLLGAILTGPPSSRSFQGALDQIKKVFHLYNTKQRSILRGADVYHILPPPAKDQWFGLQYYNTFINKGSVLLWQNGGPASQVIKLKGLDRSKTYSVSFEDAKDKNGPRTGAQLMDEGLDVPMGPNASEIVWLDLSK